MIWRRRKSLVNPRQQISFAMELVAVALGFLFICAFMLFMPPMSELVGDPMQAERLFDELMKFVFLKWPMFMLAMGILVVIGVLMSHRLAGPLFGLERTLESWREGKRGARVYFRKYDYLLPAKESLNSFFAEYEQMLKDVESQAKEAIGALEQSDTGKAKASTQKIVDLVSASREEK